MKRIPIWIDSDTGVDDAIALFTAFKQKQLDIRGITAVMGNHTLENTFRNARDVVSLAGETYKVYKGASKPLFKELEVAEYVHGHNGIGDVVIPLSKAPVEKETGYDAMYKEAKRLKGELTIVAIGPLTDIAIAIIKYPDLKKYVKQIAIMGGAIEGGNVTPCAEFNTYTDPEAAQIVFKSGIHIIMCGLDVTMKAVLTPSEIKKIAKLNNEPAKMLIPSTKLGIELYKVALGKNLYCLHDLCPILYLIDPKMFKVKEGCVYVETMGGISYGKTISDIYNGCFKYKKKNTTVVLDLDRKKFVKYVYDAYKQY